MKTIQLEIHNAREVIPVPDQSGKQSIKVMVSDDLSWRKGYYNYEQSSWYVETYDAFRTTRIAERTVGINLWFYLPEPL